MKKIHIFILLSAIIFQFLGAAPAMAKKNKEKAFTVVVDPGHGGKDIGATDNKAREKDINLGVALQLQKILNKKLKDINVVMTRDDDTYLTLQKRADVANKAKGDLFISIHTNSVDKSNKNRKNVAGSSVYALGLHKDDNNMKVARRENAVIELEDNFEQKYSGFDPSRDESYIIFEMAQKKNLSKSIKFAEDVQKNLVKSGRANRGVHQAGFWVLWATSMPSVLVELDFICNPKSAKYMTSEKGQKELAEAIFKAVETYHDNWKGIYRNQLSSIENKGSDHPFEPELEGDRTVAERSQKVVVASSKSRSRKLTSAPSATSRSNAYGTVKRRRRSEAARRNSLARSFETSAIPLHSESERRGVTVEPESNSETVELAVEKVEQDSKKRNKKSKKDKKAEKERKKMGKKSKRSPSAHNAKIDKFVKVYKIQVLASADLLKQNNPRFCGLAPISAYKENDLYKYYYGESQNEDEIKKLLKEVKKVIPDAFVVSSMKSKANTQN